MRALAHHSYRTKSTALQPATYTGFRTTPTTTHANYKSPPPLREGYADDGTQMPYLKPRLDTMNY
jgi:hypothetical protein